jgi:uncharacterized protein with ParB-like and HNH nuclease domain
MAENSPINVRGDEAAYTTFETLNDRDHDLAPLDLIKNYLFGRAGKGKKSGGRKFSKEFRYQRCRSQKPK